MSFSQTFGRFCVLVVAMLGPAIVNGQNATRSPAQTDGNGATSQPTVIMRTTKGDIVIELDADQAPGTVDNFLAYVDDNFYADTLFHRVIDGFMIQGGGFTTNYQRKPTRPPVSNEAYNGLRNTRYTIAMARTTAPHSATSQFFINSDDNRNLDHTNTTQRGWGYTVFGRVTEGRDIVDVISSSSTGAGGPFSRDVPLEPIVILGIDRLTSTPAETPAEQSSPADEENGTGLPAESAAPANPAKAIIQDVQQNTSALKASTRVELNAEDSGVSTEPVNQN